MVTSAFMIKHVAWKQSSMWNFHAVESFPQTSAEIAWEFAKLPAIDWDNDFAESYNTKILLKMLSKITSYRKSDI